MKITTIKKKIAMTAMVVLLGLSSAFTVYAEVPKALENDIAVSKEKLKQTIADLEAAGEDDSAKKIQVVMDALDSLDDDDSSLQSADDVKKLIFNVITDESVLEATGWKNGYDVNAAIFQTSWLNELSNVVSAYGINMGEYEYRTKNLIHLENEVVQKGSEDGSDELERTEATSKMIQKLRWNQIDSDSKLNVSGLLKQYETTFAGFTTMLQSIAAALVVAFGASNLLKMTSDRMIGYDAVLREFFKLIFGVWFIFNYRYFTILILRMGSYITEFFLDGTAYDVLSDDSETAAIYKYGLWRSFVSVAESMPTDFLNGFASAATGALNYMGNTFSDLSGFGSALSGVLSFFAGEQLVNIGINWVVFAILIELGIRYTFTPIAIADLYNEGYRSNGARWLKKLLSCAMTGALIFLVLYGVNVMKKQLSWYQAGQKIAINCTLMGFFAKCRQIADEIVGVR